MSSTLAERAPGRSDAAAESVADAALRSVQAAIIAGRYQPSAIDIERFWRLEKEMGRR